MIPDILDKIALRQDLEAEEAEYLVTSMIKGNLDEVQSAAALIGLRTKGESKQEIASFVKVLQTHAVPIHLNASGAVDLCGTGGDRSGTFNISTACMFVVAGAGIPVIKHGNRSISSQSGSADVLEALGVHLELTPEQSSDLYEKIGLAFLFAPNYHPLLKQIGSVRKRLAVRTIFNLLGPLLNPAKVSRQVIGVYAKDAAEKIHSVAGILDKEVLIAIHSLDGQDEVSLNAPSWIFEYRNGISSDEPTLFDPASMQLSCYSLGEIRGADAFKNAEIIRSILDNQATPAQRDVVLINSTFGILAGQDGILFSEAYQMAKESLFSGAAKNKLSELIQHSQS